VQEIAYTLERNVSRRGEIGARKSFFEERGCTDLLVWGTSHGGGDHLLADDKICGLEFSEGEKSDSAVCAGKNSLDEIRREGVQRYPNTGGEEGSLDKGEECFFSPKRTSDGDRKSELLR